MRAHGKFVVVLALLTTAFYWKLATPLGEFVWFDHPDMCWLEIPRLTFQARELDRGRFPLWDQHVWMGQPLIGQAQPGPIYPLNLLMMLAPLDSGHYIRFRTLNVYFIVLHFIAALGAYLLCRGLHRSPAASLVGAAAFSFAGFTGSVAWLDVLNGAIWIPFVAYFFLRAVRDNSPRHAGLSGVFLGLAWLSGHHEIPLMTTLALLAAWAFSRRFLLGAASLSVGGLIAAAQVLPMVEFGRLAQRWGPANGPVGWNDPVAYLSSTIYSLTPRNLAGIILPNHGTNADSSAFLGIVTVALTALAIATLWRLRPIRWLAALAAAAAVYSLGAFTPVHGWLYMTVPMLDKARIPSRAIVLLDFALVILAAYGADQFLRGHGRQAARRIAAVAAAIGALIFIAVVIFRVGYTDEVLLAGLLAFAFFALERARIKLSKTVAASALLLLMIAEWHLAFTKPWQSRYTEKAQSFAKSLKAHGDIVDFLRAQPGAVRVRVNDTQIPVNFGDLHGIDMQEGYFAGVTTNLLHWGRHTANGQRLLAITHYVGRERDRPNQELAFQGREDNMKVFRVTDPLSRARAVHLVESVPDPGRLAMRIEEPSFDPATTALLVNEPVPQLESCAGDEVGIGSYAPNRVRIQANMRCRGLVILADTYFPGWQASVDGRPAKIHAVYAGLRGVVVEAGRHEIEYRYRPMSVFAGAALMLVGLLLASVLPRRVRSMETPSGHC
jgi:hypothetical protein